MSRLHSSSAMYYAICWPIGSLADASSRCREDRIAERRRKRWRGRSETTHFVPSSRTSWPSVSLGDAAKLVGNVWRVSRVDDDAAISGRKPPVKLLELSKLPTSDKLVDVFRILLAGGARSHAYDDLTCSSLQSGTVLLPKLFHRTVDGTRQQTVPITVHEVSFGDYTNWLVPPDNSTSWLN